MNVVTPPLLHVWDGRGGRLGKMAQKKTRPASGFLSMFVLIIGMAVVTLIIVATTGMVSFTPNGPERGEVARVDAAAYVRQEQANMDFPVVLPEVPAEWIPNAARRASYDGEPAPTIGWVTDDDLYVQVSQTTATADDIVRSAEVIYQPAGTSDIEGVTFTHYEAENERPLWIGDTGDVRVAVTGSGGDEKLTTLAAAVILAQSDPTSLPQ